MTNKKRILWCTEATYLYTGYANYSREVLSRLHSTGKYEITEFATYGRDGDEKNKNIPWNFIPNQPVDEKGLQNYKSMSCNQFGAYRFEEACLLTKPDFVCDIRDWWMSEHIERSPYRKYFYWLHMPTVDSTPQHKQWIQCYSEADVILTYTDWALNVLRRQMDGSKLAYSVPPCAPDYYKPVKDKAEHKDKFRILSDTFIVGTVMRNQKRKLYPDLMQSFRRFLDKYESDPEIQKVMLYCHTSYPDIGWDIPELLKEYGLGNKVLFTYKCQKCNHYYPNYFRGIVDNCPKCRNQSGIFVSVQNGIAKEELANVMNLFDLYVQPNNSEGFGMPLVEAAACGVPVCGTNFSASSETTSRLGGSLIEVSGLHKEPDTGCYRASIDIENLADIIYKYSRDKEYSKKQGVITRKLYEENYNYDVTAAKWMNIIDQVPARDLSTTWYSNPDIKQSQPQPNAEFDNIYNYSGWLITNVLCQPEKLNTYFHAKVIKDIASGLHARNIMGEYHHDFPTNINPYEKMDLNKAYQFLKKRRDKINFYENLRAQSMQKGAK